MKKLFSSISLLFVPLIGGILFLNACNDSTQVAGGQDFPNSLEQLAMLGFQGVNETQNLSHASVREVNHTGSDTAAANPPVTGFRPITAKTSALARLASPQNGAFQLGTGGVTWYYDMRDTSGD